MGNSYGKDDSDFNLQSNEGFVLISNEPEKQLCFNPQQSVILSFGIDKQIHPNYIDKSLGLTVKLDALEVTKALIEHLNINAFKTFCSSDNPSSCTQAGIEGLIEQTANEVGKDGIFILFFGGHGVNDDDKKWALAPADFDRSPSTYVTTETINRCIKRSNCRAKCVLVILDCCYSGVMGSDMTNNEKYLLPNLYVLAAGSAYESSFAVSSLHHSIFSYFLKVALELIPLQSGTFPLADVYDLCKDCTGALSSLILTIDNCSVKAKHAVPSLSHFHAITDDTFEDVDGEALQSVKPGRLNFVFELYGSRYSKSRPRLHPETHNWLRNLICGHYQPIYLIQKRQLFETDNDNLLKTVVALIVQSIAVLELFHNSETVGEPDIFLTGFIQTVALVDFVLPNCDIGPDYLIVSFALYHRVLVRNKVDDCLMKELLLKIQKACFKEVLTS